MKLTKSPQLSIKEIPKGKEMMKGYLVWDILTLVKYILIVDFNISKTSNLIFSLRISTNLQKALQFPGLFELQ